MKSENFFIIYPLQSVDLKNNVKTPFKITVRTNDGLIERKCKELFPDLMVASFYNQDQLIRLQQMKRFIKTAFLKRDEKALHELFYKDKYLYPLKFEKPLSKITLTDFDCKLWTNNEPRLEIQGYITININDVFQRMYETSIIKIKHNKKLIRQEIVLTLEKSLPLLLLYERPSDCKNRIVTLIDTLLKDKNSYLYKDLIKLVKNAYFGDLTKEVTWSGLMTITIGMNDLSENIINKLKNNKGKIAFGYLLYKSLKK